MIYDAASRESKKLWEFPLETSFEYVRLSGDEKRAYVLTLGGSLKKGSCSHAVWEYSFESAECRELTKIENDDFYPPRLKTIDLDERAYTALFGDRCFPVQEPHFVCDGKYYFYKMKRDGLMARMWVGCLDKYKKSNHAVTTLWRSLYAE